MPFSLFTCLFMTGSVVLQVLQPHVLSDWNSGHSVRRVLFLLSLLHIVAATVFLRFKCLLMIFVMSAHFMMTNKMFTSFINIMSPLYIIYELPASSTMTRGCFVDDVNTAEGGCIDSAASSLATGFENLV